MEEKKSFLKHILFSDELSPMVRFFLKRAFLITETPLFKVEANDQYF